MGSLLPLLELNPFENLAASVRLRSGSWGALSVPARRQGWLIWPSGILLLGKTVFLDRQSEDPYPFNIVLKLAPQQDYLGPERDYSLAYPKMVARAPRGYCQLDAGHIQEELRLVKSLLDGMPNDLKSCLCGYFMGLCPISPIRGWR